MAGEVFAAGHAETGSVGMSRSMAYHAEVQHVVAEMVIEIESIGPHIEKVAQDWSDSVDYGTQWATKLTAARYRAVEGSWHVVDTALELAGGFGFSRNPALSVCSVMHVSAAFTQPMRF